MKTSDQALDTRSNNPSLEAMPKKSKYPPVSADQTVSESFATILRHNFENLGRWEQTAHSGSDIEGVHQLRVTVRRMRSALPLFESAIPRSSDRHWRQEMRWLAGELGLARDLDVFISEVLVSLDSKLPLKGADRFMRIAQRRRARAYEEQVRGIPGNGKRPHRVRNGRSDWLRTLFPMPENAWTSRSVVSSRPAAMSIGTIRRKCTGCASPARNCAMRRSSSNPCSQAWMSSSRT